MKNRPHIITVRLNQAEYDHLNEQAEKSTVSKEALMRSLIMGLNIHSRPCKHHGKLLSTLSDISNGVNEILRRSRTGEALKEKDIALLRKLLTDTWQIMSERY